MVTAADIQKYPGMLLLILPVGKTWDQFNSGTFSTLPYLVLYQIIDFDFFVFGFRISADRALWDFVQLLLILAKKSKVFCFERNIQF